MPDAIVEVKPEFKVEAKPNETLVTAPPTPSVAPDAALEAAHTAMIAWQADTTKPELKTAAEAALTAAKAAQEEFKKSLELSKAPSEYKLELPKESLLKPEDLETVKAFAKANKLTQDQAKAILEDRNAQALKSVESQKAQLAVVKEAWLKETMADPEVGGEKLKAVAEGARRVLAKYGNPELNKFLDETGYGNNVNVIRFFNNLYKTMSEDTLVIGSGPQNTTKEKSLADILREEAAAKNK